MTRFEHDLVVVGGGTAGLVSAAGAAYLGARPAIVEREALGGDCLWTGCVPSKALLATARLAAGMADAPRLGLAAHAPAHDFAAIMARMREARGVVARHDDPERFRSMGVAVHLGEARFTGPGELEVEGVGRIRSKRFVIATGARPRMPPVPGLAESGAFTHETLFERDEVASPVVVLGGGPVGLELAQVLRRVGLEVTVVEMLAEVLPAEDPDVAASLRTVLESEGIGFRLGRAATRVEGAGEAREVVLDDGTRLPAAEILVATGRAPRTGELRLEAAGVRVNGADAPTTGGFVGPGGVAVDRSLRTTARGVWAAGDVTGGLQFTHAADAMARVVVRNALLPFSARVRLEGVPRVTYTDPEVAHVGLSAAEAEARGARRYEYSFSDLDRAIVDASTEGFVRISADGRGRILGATILGRGAGDLLVPLLLARGRGIPLPAIANTIFPYPTMAEGVKRAADAFQRARLEGPAGRLLRGVVRWLA